MDHMHRELAPITDEAWERIDEEAREVLDTSLAGRRIADVRGPLGWEASAVDLGRARLTKKPLVAGALTAVREVLPLIELRVPFELARSEIDAISRGARNFDLDPLVDAARIAARAEDTLVMYGMQELGRAGLMNAGGEAVRMQSDMDYADFPEYVVEAMAMLRLRGVEGPYVLALGPQCYEGAARATHRGGYPVLQHLRTLIETPPVWAPAIDGSLLVSRRGGDLQLTIGSDFAIGYIDHDATTVSLYIEETVAFEIAEDAAVVPLIYS